VWGSNMQTKIIIIQLLVLIGCILPFLIVFIFNWLFDKKKVPQRQHIYIIHSLVFLIQILWIVCFITISTFQQKGFNESPSWYIRVTINVANKFLSELVDVFAQLPWLGPLIFFVYIFTSWVGIRWYKMRWVSYTYVMLGAALLFFSFFIWTAFGQ